MNIDQINKYIDDVEKSQFLQVTEPVNADELKVGLDLGTAFIVIVVLDSQNRPIACEYESARVLRDGVVVDFIGAKNIVTRLKTRIEDKLGCELVHCAIAMPPGTESSTKTHIYVAEGAGFDVINILDEPTAANAVYNAKDGVVVDIGGGTTGLAIFQDGKSIFTADEATGGFHMSLVLAGSLDLPYEDAESLKMDETRHQEIYPILKPVMEKMATIVHSYIKDQKQDVIYLCGGTCSILGIEEVFEKITGIPTIKADRPFLVTPIGIAMNCIGKQALI
ncbi:MAG: ethanolamine utilization protein EutJ [Clostridiales Family XIII bacterium]|jgi:ethanolamine utilization protein EutJ|nr:ethanolamine utilization protein EutJ [Clostridiales Family XIII bacterium]